MSVTTRAIRSTTLTAGRLPRWAVPAIGVGSLALAYIAVDLATPGSANPGLVVALAFVLHLVGVEVSARAVEGGRQAVDRRAVNLVVGAFLLALVPL
ncbi:MAG TPA: hypothetical protein PLE12_04830, partial [Propionicimonas sp.]|nr:hypothetical protein [Propionicimonas sp.]